MASKTNKKRNKHKDEGAEHDGRSNHNGSKIISDSRFAAVPSDPRFREAPNHNSKVVIDSRFNRLFTDKNFASTKALIDKRGKPKNKSSKNSLKHYYRLEEEEEEKERNRREELLKKLEENKESKSESEAESNGSESTESEEESESGESDGKSEKGEKLKKKRLKMKSESDAESEDGDDGESDGSSTSTTDSDEEHMYPEEEETFVQEENVPEIDKETHRLAVVNMDWGRVKAVDLYVLLSSFLPKGGQIKSVAVYPSEFGLQRMEGEAVHGPVGLFDDEKGNNKDEDDDDDDEEIDNEKLRAYELSRLRYYYAVVECDSIATADYLYRTCDGVEFERTSNKLDLRFIPDSMEFKHQPRDVATEAPENYEGLDFHTRALQHSTIQLTWDEDEPQRSRTLKRKFNADQLAELELEDFLASDNSETEESENENDMGDRQLKKHKKQDMYRALLQSGDGSDGDNEDDQQDMEVTFNTGLEDLSKRILEKKDKKSETVWEAYLRKRKEKKKAKKNRSKNSSEDESSDTDQESMQQPDDFFVEEYLPDGGKESQGRHARKRNKNQETLEAEASRAELELLLADDKGGDANLKGYNLKPKKNKGRKGKEILDEGKIPTADFDDPRFSSLFTSPLFALDPTDPQFKRSATYVRQIAQKQKIDGKDASAKEQYDLPRQSPLPNKPVTEDDGQLQSNNLPSKKEKHELSALVRSIKVKSKQLPVHSYSKVSRKTEKRDSKVKT